MSADNVKPWDIVWCSKAEYLAEKQSYKGKSEILHQNCQGGLNTPCDVKKLIELCNNWWVGFNFKI